MKKSLWRSLSLTVLSTSTFWLAGESTLLASPLEREPSSATTIATSNPVTLMEPRQRQESPVSLLPHAWRAGRLAVTLRLYNIPVVTFLGTAAELEAAQNRRPLNGPDSVFGRAQAIASQLESWTQATDFDAQTIQVSYDKKGKVYQIEVGEKIFLQLDQNTVLPDATPRANHNALQMANRLRRLLGQAPPLAQAPSGPAHTASLNMSGPPAQFRRLKTGMASWYGPGFHGRRTANGERYNQHGLTAAHRSLPFGTRVRVTNLHTGQSVVVRINDRGPFVGGRIIDLSAGAAKAIGVHSRGTARVAMDILQ